ncbi:MAG: hypothetical protein J5930_05995, partial [Treponema sp.]|nr:hypothetical protein [Treponema sp.]
LSAPREPVGTTAAGSAEDFKKNIFNPSKTCYCRHFLQPGIGFQFAPYARLEGPVASGACFTSFYFLARLEFFLRKKRKNLPLRPIEGAALAVP